MVDRLELSASKAVNYTAERVLRALEVLVFAPSSAPTVADAIGIDARTARRLLRTLTQIQYVERRQESGRAGHAYVPTVRLLALAAQLAPRLPLVEHGGHAASELQLASAMAAYLAIPSYCDVLVIARAGEHAPLPWTMLPAAEHASGRLLLAHREAWRRSLRAAQCAGGEDLEHELSLVRKRGYAMIIRDGDGAGSLAVAVPNHGAPPLAALAIHGPSATLTAREKSLVELLQHTAAQLAHRVSSTPLAPVARACR